jgi:hypothetical protein
MYEREETIAPKTAVLTTGWLRRIVEDDECTV